MTCCLLVWQCQLGVPGRVGRRWGPVVSRRGQSVGAAGPGPRPALAAADPGAAASAWNGRRRPGRSSAPGRLRAQSLCGPGRSLRGPRHPQNFGDFNMFDVQRSRSRFQISARHRAGAVAVQTARPPFSRRPRPPTPAGLHLMSDFGLKRELKTGHGSALNLCKMKIAKIYSGSLHEEI